MPAPLPERRQIECPQCRSLNVIVMLVTSTVVSLHCLSCDRQFAVEVLPSSDAR
jgi:transcription elongation factor Elf1